MPRLDYFAPGVYVEEVDRGSRPIEGVSTNIAGFIGFTEDVRGDAELFKPMLVTSWNEYLEYYAKQGSDGYTDFDAYLPFAVNGWFLNGGGRCWVASIGTKLPGTQPPPAEETALKIRTTGNRPSLQFALKPAEGENDQTGEEGRLNVAITESQPRPPENPEAEPPLNTGEFFKVVISRNGEVLEEYDHLSMNPEVQAETGTYVLTALQESQFVNALDLETPGQPLSRRPANGSYEVSPPPVISTPDRFPRDVQGVRDDRTGMQGIFEIDEVTMIAFPDLLRAYQNSILDLDQVHGIMETMVSLCENTAPNRMVVLDPPPCKGGGTAVSPTQVKPQHIAQWLSAFNRRSQFAALYYPWIKVPNPRNGGRPILVPPSGHMLGVWCRTDETRGVYKAPANDTPRGVIGLAYETNLREQELLNPLGINCIRTFPNRGIRIWGARTLVEPDNVQWRYISVRRLMSYIEKSVELGTQWVVFEPNDQDLWARVTRTVSNFLERLWREGALFGASAAEAFYVKCDASINTHETMMLGRLYIEVGVCPVRPAEFVIFRFSQWAPNQ
ncbi:phage tail protein [Nostoc minutum NIES-26]|uniref:Phage tail protein n=1 Tax=Nostoc minutum NIES-26 TaxID=1844469 RepID=A0A367R834_9NOSO|nr:phage tail sheath C-terminal domain-containing protein [Dendronalium sp. ChiSLP03b]MDZ8204168.1 phage tail sheath subtilisin-like domain-containing protein [Dendronalium sp. ChiSLP03b]RCJ31582.1 phage tail protein [Nostoc minutum NIES-26]